MLPAGLDSVNKTELSKLVQFHRPIVQRCAAMLGCAVYGTTLFSAAHNPQFSLAVQRYCESLVCHLNLAAVKPERNAKLQREAELV